MARWIGRRAAFTSAVRPADLAFNAVWFAVSSCRPRGCRHDRSRMWTPEADAVAACLHAGASHFRRAVQIV
jgi:hypothetical protein